MDRRGKALVTFRSARIAEGHDVALKLSGLIGLLPAFLILQDALADALG